MNPLLLQAPRAWTLLTAASMGVAAAGLLLPLGIWPVAGAVLVLALAYGDMWLRHREEFAAGALHARPLDGMSALHALVPFLFSLVLALGARTFDLPFPSLGLFALLWSLCAAIVLADLLFILPPAVVWFLARHREDGRQHTGGGS